MSRLFVTQIKASHVEGHLEAGQDGDHLAVKLGETDMPAPSLTKSRTFQVALPTDFKPAGQILTIWLTRDPTVHICVPLHLASDEPNSLDEDVRLLRAELEMVKTALRRALGPQGHG